MSLKKYLPTREQLRAQKSLRFLGEMIFEPNLWHMNRHSVSWAFWVGIFCCFLPIPFQMIPCLFICIWIRCNVPISIALVWISNPITMPPMMYATYRLGLLILDQPSQVEGIEISVEWFTAKLSEVWQPLLLGSLLTGFALGALGFMSVRLYWRWRVTRYWYSRRQRKKLDKRNRKELS